MNVAPPDLIKGFQHISCIFQHILTYFFFCSCRYVWSASWIGHNWKPCGLKRLGKGLWEIQFLYKNKAQHLSSVIYKGIFSSGANYIGEIMNIKVELIKNQDVLKNSKKLQPRVSVVSITTVPSNAFSVKF